MWRAFFVALGISFCILGGECLIIDNAVLAKSDPENLEAVPPLPIGEKRSRVVKPPEWAPWSLISVGAVTLIYSFTIPRRNAT